MSTTSKMYYNLPIITGDTSKLQLSGQKWNHTQCELQIVVALTVAVHTCKLYASHTVIDALLVSNHQIL